MEEKSAVERGWEFSAKLVGSDISAQTAKAYVGRIEKAIEALRSDLSSISTGWDDARLGGFAAESWHAGTFNIDAAAAGSRSVATAGKPGTTGALGRNNYASVDVQVQTGDGRTIDYGSKYDKNFKLTAKEQSTPNPDTNAPKYTGQERLVPSDQLDQVKDYAGKRASNPETPERWAKGYQETHDTAVDRVSDGKVSSKPLSKEGSEELAREIRKDDIDLEKRGVTVDAAIKPEYIMKQAAQAGLSAAVVTMIMQTAPEIFKAIDYLIKTGEIDLNQIKRIGTKAITSGAEGFLRGSVACTLQILCEKGVFGEVLKKIDPTFLGVAVALTIETIKNSILVAAGKMAPREMGAKLVDGVVISTGFVVGTKLGAAIGGAIGQAIGFELPVVGYILGSLIGCAFSAVYNIGKNKLISFCVDTGFTCFGLVDQNYQIPEDVLRDMGIDITPVLRTDVERVDVSRTEIPRIALGQRAQLETIDMHVLRRGIIGVNKVGYVY